MYKQAVNPIYSVTTGTINRSVSALVIHSLTETKQQSVEPITTRTPWPRKSDLLSTYTNDACGHRTTLSSSEVKLLFKGPFRRRIAYIFFGPS